MSKENQFSKKFDAAAATPTRRGAFFIEEADDKGLALVEGKAGDIKIYWLVDPESGMVKHAAYFTYGGARSVAIGETYCAMAIDTPIDAALSLSGSDIEKQLRDDQNTPSAPLATFTVVVTLATALKQAWPKARDRATALVLLRKAAAAQNGGVSPDDQWQALAKEEKLKRIEAALDGPVRDYLLMEGGDITIIDVVDNTEVVVNFEGACGSCPSSAGSTLFAVEHELRQKVYPRLRVVTGSYGYPV
jgi:NifU-like protein